MSENNSTFLHIVSMQTIGDNIYFKASNLQGTFCLENKKNIRLLYEYANDYQWCPYQYSDCVRMDNSVIFIPYTQSPYVVIYDTVSERFEYIKNEGDKKYKIGVPFEDKVYFFGEHLDGNAIAEFDVRTRKVKELKWSSGQEIPSISFNNYCRAGNTLYFTNFGYGSICTYNLENHNSQLFKLHTDECAPSSVLIDEDRVWITGNEDEIYVYDNAFHLLRTIKLNKSIRDCPWKQRFSASEVMGDYIYFAPVYYGSIIKINRFTMTVEDVYELNEDEVCWSICILDDEHLFFDIYNFKTADAGNVIVSNEGDVVKNDKRFSISNLYYPNDLAESKVNTLAGYLKYLREA